MSTEGKKAWDADTMGYGKHAFHHIDPDTINVNDFAQNLRGEEQHFGDVRQYNTAYNEMHPEHTLGIDWLGRVGTIFETNAEGFEGIWCVTNMPIVNSPSIFCRVVKLENVDEDPEGKTEVTIPCVKLGCVVNEENLYEQVRSVILKKGDVSRTQRLKLTKKN